MKPRPFSPKMVALPSPTARTRLLRRPRAAWRRETRREPLLTVVQCKTPSPLLRVDGRACAWRSRAYHGPL